MLTRSVFNFFIAISSARRWNFEKCYFHFSQHPFILFIKNGTFTFQSIPDGFFYPFCPGWPRAFLTFLLVLFYCHIIFLEFELRKVLSLLFSQTQVPDPYFYLVCPGWPGVCRRKEGRVETAAVGNYKVDRKWTFCSTSSWKVGFGHCWTSSLSFRHYFAFQL